MVNKEKKIILLTPSKCSSNSLINLLLNNGINLESPLRDLDDIYSHPTLSEICYSHDIDLESIQNYKIIQIVRNPYDRFISGYNHQKSIYPLCPPLGDFIYNLEKNKYLLPYNINDFYKKFYGDIGFKYFSRSNNNGWGGLRFWYEQNWWNNIEVKVNIFKLEEISNNSLPLTNLLNIPNTPYPKIKKGEYKKINLDKELKSKIYNLYKNDFIKYNY